MWLTMGATSKCHFVQKLSSSLKTPKIGILGTLEGQHSYVDLWLKWCLNQSCSLHREFSNYMWHATYTHLFQGDSWLLMGGNQIGTLTFGPSFGHNLCFKYSNGSCEPILDIYVSKSFQWYIYIIQLVLTFDIPLWKFKTP
jgi:hypothetical protein